MADAALSVMETTDTTPKKKTRFPKKNQKPDRSKNNQQRNILQNSNERDIRAEPFDTRVGPCAVESCISVEGIKTVTPEKEDTGQRPQIKHKKKYIDNPKKIIPAKVYNNNPAPQASQSQEEGSRKSEMSKEKLSRVDKWKQGEPLRRQMEEERRKRWYTYFMTKHNDLILLDRNKVVVLKSVEKSRPQAQFVCKVCNYFCDNMSVVAAHIRKTIHQRQLQDYNDEMTLREMPEMRWEHLSFVNNYLHLVVSEKGMSPADLETRRTIAVLVDDLVTAGLAGCSIRLFGSSVHGLGLKTADVNIDLQVPEGSLPPSMLKAVAALIRKSPHFVNVEKNFECEFPYVSFEYKKSGENCSISLNNERAVNLAILLSKYTPLDPRLAQLATLLRLWGQLTETDRAKEGTFPGYAFFLMTIFYLQQCTDPVLPVLNDLLVEKGDSESANTIKVLSMDVSDIKEKWRTNNNQSLAALWIGMLRFYTVDFDYTEYTISIDSSALIPRKTRKLFIVDPFLPTRNVVRSMTSNAMFYYIVGCLMTTCKYFGMPQSKYGPLFGEIYKPACRYHPDHEAKILAHNRINSQLIQLIMKLDSNFSLPKKGIQETMGEVLQAIHINDYQNIDNIPMSYLERSYNPPRQSYHKMFVSPADARLLINSFSPRAMEYSFTAFNCTGGQKIPKICSVCKDEGHSKDDCPEEKLPVLEPLPPRSHLSLILLDHLCHYIFEKWKQNEEDIQLREKICRELQSFIRDVHPTARLELFGSTKNGFGLKGSDMDICLTFDDNITGEGLDTRAFIEVLYRILRNCKAVKDLLPISTAKVPIVKFCHKDTLLEGDISLYNVLAMENSKLLYTYTQIDSRAQILGYMMKRFSKVCHIGDASKGSLSSYAYSLLVIYFLQQCDPPVLPVLQELSETGGPPPKHFVEGCNAYFFKDLSKLDKVWPGKGKNTLGIGELWLHLLIFYTERFDMLNNVVCIRCSRTVCKFEKLWISKGIAIEDPFDLSHNLGSALTRKMSLYIIKAFRKGRNHFARPVELCASNSEIEAYYLDPKELTEGEPPNDRGCRFCKSIGHKERSCPEKQKGQAKSKKQEGTKKQKTLPKLTPLKTTSGDDEEDEDEDDDSDTDKGSSDQEEQPRKSKTEQQISSKFEVASQYKQTLNSELSGNYDHNSSKKVRKNLIPDIGRKFQETNHTTGPSFGPFRTSTPPQTQTRSSKTPKTQNLTKNRKTTPTADNCSQMPIPTIVFNNSKLPTDTAPLNLIRYPTLQEPSRPPPGFISLPHNCQLFPNSVSFPQETKQVGQNKWNFEGIPFYATTSMTNPSMEFMRNVPVYASPSPTTPMVPSGASLRPSVFNNVRFNGMLPPTEQLIWGQGPPSFHPDRTEASAVHTIDASLSKIQLNSPSPVPNISSFMNISQEEELSIQKNSPKNKREQNSTKKRTASKKTLDKST